MPVVAPGETVCEMMIPASKVGLIIGKLFLFLKKPFSHQTKNKDIKIQVKVIQTLWSLMKWITCFVQSNSPAQRCACQV